MLLKLFLLTVPGTEWQEKGEEKGQWVRVRLTLIIFCRSAFIEEGCRAAEVFGFGLSKWKCTYRNSMHSRLEWWKVGDRLTTVLPLVIWKVLPSKIPSFGAVVLNIIQNHINMPPDRQQRVDIYYPKQTPMMTEAASVKIQLKGQLQLQTFLPTLRLQGVSV